MASSGDPGKRDLGGQVNEFAHEISSQAANTYSKAESDDYGWIKGRASAHSKSDTPSIF